MPGARQSRSMTSMLENDGGAVASLPISSALAAVSGRLLLASAASWDGKVTMMTYSPVSRSRPTTALV